MRKKTFLFVLFAAMVMTIGCATMPEPVEYRRTSAVFSAPKNKVWPLLVAEVGLNYPVQAIEKESGLLTTQFVQMRGYRNQYIYPLGGFLAVYEGLRMNLRIMAIEPEPGKTKVTINAHYEVYESNVSKSWKVARSNGSVEDDILTGIEQNLR